MKNTCYGNCDECGTALSPVWFKEQECDEYGMKTGRVRDAVSYLVCPSCLRNYVVDDSFDREWKYADSRKTRRNNR